MNCNDEDQPADIAPWYRRAFDEYRSSAIKTGSLFAEDITDSRRRIAGSIEYLAPNLHRLGFPSAPTHPRPCRGEDRRAPRIHAR